MSILFSKGGFVLVALALLCAALTLLKVWTPITVAPFQNDSPLETSPRQIVTSGQSKFFDDSWETFSAQDLAVFAKDIVMPKEVPGLPESDHVRNHPQGEFVSKAKIAAWRIAGWAWKTGKPPTWCGQREKDGAVVLFWAALQVTKNTGGVYRGVLLILKTKTGDGPSTAEFKIKADSQNENKPINGVGDFNRFPCPQFFSPAA